MSWKTINQIIGLASIDQAFRDALQQKPLDTLEAEGFQLTTEEQEIFTTCSTLSFADFCQYIVNKLEPDR